MERGNGSGKGRKMEKGIGKGVEKGQGTRKEIGKGLGKGTKGGWVMSNGKGERRRWKS